MKNKIIYYLISTIIAGSIGMLLYVYYLLFFPPHVIKAMVQPYPVKSRTVRAGATLTYLPSYCKYLALPSVSFRQFVDGLVFSTPPVASNLPAGCHKEPVVIVVPDKIPPGTYHLLLTITYTINPLRTETYQFKTEEFVITK